GRKLRAADAFRGWLWLRGARGDAADGGRDAHGAGFDVRAARAGRSIVNQPGALVIGGDYRGLGVVRSLGRRGIPVWVLDDGHRLAALSRFAERSFAWPAESSATEQIAYLLQLAATHALHGWTLFPTGDETAALLARNHERLSQHFRMTTPPWQVLRWA